MNREREPWLDRDALRQDVSQDVVDRIWARIDNDLPHRPQPASVPRRSVFPAVVSAIAAGVFGIMIGSALTGEPPPRHAAVADPVVHSTVPNLLPGLYAAGSHGRSVELEEGVKLVLGPGATLESVHGGPGSRSGLALLHGAATIDTTAARSEAPLTVWAGRVSVSVSHASVVRVSLDRDSLDVRVVEGDATLRTPDGVKRIRKGEGVSDISTRLRVASIASARVRPAPRHVRPVEPSVAPVQDPRELPQDSPPARTWRSLVEEGDMQGAWKLLSSQQGGIDAAISGASSAQELWDIHDVAIASDPAAAIRALQRVLQAFPSDASAQLAAYKLGNYYKKMGDTQEAQAWFERAEKLGGILTEDALCERIHMAAHEQQAAQAAREYVAKYPQGRCRQEAEQVLRAEQGDAGAADVLQPDAGGADGTSPLDSGTQDAEAASSP